MAYILFAVIGIAVNVVGVILYARLATEDRASGEASATIIEQPLFW